MKRKIIAASLIACMILVAVTGATLAYFTDRDYLKNEFAVGGVDIDLWEIVGYQPAKNEDGNELTPVPETIGKDTDKKFTYTYENLFPTDYATKQIMVTNNSTDAAYIRVAIVMNNHKAINAAIDDRYEGTRDEEKIQDIYDEVFDGWGIQYSHTPESGEGYTPRMWMAEREDERCLAIDMAANYGYYVYDTQNLFMTEDDHNDDGFDVKEDTGYYEKAVDEDEVIYVFYLRLKAGDTYQFINGLQVPAYFDEEQAKMFDGLTIEVYADAIQTAGFDTAEDAFEALNEIYPVGHWNAE